MYLFIIILIIIFVGIIYYFLRINIEHFSDINGVMPVLNGSTSYWGNNPVVNGYQPDMSSYSDKNCSPGTTCNDENIQFGIYNNNCECISLNKDNTESEVEEEENNLPDMENVLNNNNIRNNVASRNILDKNCLPNNTNFNELCRMKNSKYGVKKIIPCDANHSKVKCALNYINGKYYGDNVIMTPCLNKSDDFDTWCRFYNKRSDIPKGYSVNSIGAKEVLVGSLGGCNKNSAKAICDYKHIEEIPRLEPANKRINYNIYTNCLPLEGNSNNGI